MADAKAANPIPVLERFLFAHLVDPIPTYSFYVTIDNVTVANFLTCAGLTMTREVKKFAEGGLNEYQHVVPGRITYADITLSHGVTFSDTLWSWFLEGSTDGKVSQRTISIIQMVPYSMNVVRQFDIYDAFPVEWSGPSLDTRSDNTIAVDTLKIAFTHFVLQQGDKTLIGSGTKGAKARTAAKKPT